METHYPTIDVPATRDYVLRVLVDEHRQECCFDPDVDRNIVLSFESTIAEWRLASDLVGWRQLGRAMNEWWDINVPDHDWRDVLKPAKSKTLRDVCDLIAAHATEPTIRPATFFGRSCRPAAAFLTIRSMLADAGADVTTIAPSTPLHDCAADNPMTFLSRISRLVPGALPDVKVDTAMYRAVKTFIVASALLLAIAACTFFVFPALMNIVILLLMASCWILTWVAARRKPKSVQFGELRTFRDLSKLIAESAPAP